MTTLDPASKNTNAVLSNGNLTLTTTPAAYSSAQSTTSKTSGKWYFEVTAVSGGGTGALGVGLSRSLPPAGNIAGNDSDGWNFNQFDQHFYANNVQKVVGGGANAGQTFSVCVDFTNSNVWIWLPNVSKWNNQTTDDPATNTGGANGATYYNGALNTILFTGAPLFVSLAAYNGSTLTVNFGATAFVNSIPTGFSSWDPPPIGPSRTSGVVREALVQSTAVIRTGQAVREVLVKPTPGARLSMVAREALVSDIVPVRTAALVREVLLSTTVRVLTWNGLKISR